MLILIYVHPIQVSAIFKSIDSCRAPLFCFNHTTMPCWTSSTVRSFSAGFAFNRWKYLYRYVLEISFRILLFFSVFVCIYVLVKPCVLRFIFKWFYCVFLTSASLVWNKEGYFRMRFQEFEIIQRADYVEFNKGWK